MKKLTTILIFGITLVVSAVTLIWEYDVKQLDKTAAFEIWHSIDNIDWQPIAGTKDTSIVIKVERRMQFFKVWVTNFWENGNSEFSEVVSTPNVVTNGVVNLTIYR
jgi:hypothetical protein